MKNLYRAHVDFDIFADSEANALRILMEKVYGAHDELNGIRVLDIRKAENEIT